MPHGREDIELAPADDTLGGRITGGIISPSTGARLAPSLDAIQVATGAFGSGGVRTPGTAFQGGLIGGLERGQQFQSRALENVLRQQKIEAGRIELETLPEKTRLELEKQRRDIERTEILNRQGELDFEIDLETRDYEVLKRKAEAAQAVARARALKSFEQERGAFFEEINSGDPNRVYNAVTNPRFSRVALSNEARGDVALAIAQHEQGWTPEQKRLVGNRFKRPAEILNNKPKQVVFEDALGTLAANPQFESIRDPSRGDLENFNSIKFIDASKIQTQGTGAAMTSTEKRRRGLDEGIVAEMTDSEGRKQYLKPDKEFMKLYQQARKLQRASQPSFLTEGKLPAGGVGAQATIIPDNLPIDQGVRIGARVEREQPPAPSLREQLGPPTQRPQTSSRAAQANLGFRAPESVGEVAQEGARQQLERPDQELPPAGSIITRPQLNALVDRELLAAVNRQKARGVQLTQRQLTVARERIRKELETQYRVR